MKKVKFIYNPFSGEHTILDDLDNVIRIHQKYDYTIVPFRISNDRELEEAFDDIDDTYKYVLIAGGDGTVDNVVNTMKGLKIDLPIAILPVGTANDFAKFIGMPSNVEVACEQILKSEITELDLGKVVDAFLPGASSWGNYYLVY